jgi:Putative transposase/Transposase zinc-binding domain
VLEVAEIVRLHGQAYLRQYGGSLSSVQKRALRDISACRTPLLGGHVYKCGHCQEKIFSYHSCCNRSCPKCHQAKTERWIDKQRGRLPPCSYFLVTFTLPAELRPLARTHPKKIYSLLMKAAADALQKLAADPQHLGAGVGALAVLHTWTRAMLFHPHVHMLVTAGGLAPDGQTWVEPKHPKFLVPDPALSIIFRAKFCAGLKKLGLLSAVPVSAWKKNWVVHSQHAGCGGKVLDYLGRYVFRIAISNSRLESIDNGMVRFRYRDNRSQEIRRVTLTGVDFIGRFLHHVLPHGAAKVRHYGIFSPSSKFKLARTHQLLPQIPAHAESSSISAHAAQPQSPAPVWPTCPLCRVGTLVLIGPVERGRSP